MMLFNSYVFIIVFLPAILLLWHALGRWNQARLFCLVLASFIFYGWARWEFTLLLGGSTLIDFVVGKRIYQAQRPQTRWLWLMVSLTSNLGLLGYFKYCGFFAESYNSIVQFLHTGSAIHVPNIILPVGISFYTFQTLSYSIDLFRRDIQPAKSLLHFAAYVSMFPQLIAGPIVRYQDIEEQLNSLSARIDWDLISKGVWFFVIGMCQKILIADSLATQITPILSDVGSMKMFAAWYALLGYTGQLYFDFAGYSNMAIGLGYFLGFEFPANFKSPYKAESIQDFWRRWHITLSSFLRDYLYIPLGGNRHGTLLSMRNVLIVMLLGGLWHGAGWNFVLWGAYHGLLLALYSFYRAQESVRIPKVIAIAITFICVMFGWLLFRSTDLSMAKDWSEAMFGLHGVEAAWVIDSSVAKAIMTLCVALAICFFLPNAEEFQPKPRLSTAVALAMLLIVCIMRFDVESPFLYFQF